MEHAIDKFFKADAYIHELKLPIDEVESAEDYAPTVTLKLHCMDLKELKKAFNENNRLITKTLEKYQSRYTTKANAAIYELMVIALRSELQNILYNLKYDKLEKSIEDIKTITQKYLSIASNGNQSIAPTLVKFIGEIEHLFIEAAKIEYEYYIQKEKQKEEQAMLREQMRQDAEDRRILEQQKKQVEKEEEKYKNEIAKVEELLSSTTDDAKLKQLQDKIAELQLQLHSVEHKKEEIVRKIMVEKQVPEFHAPIKRIGYEDGCKVYFEDDSFVSCRFSGTEPLLRIFAEADNREKAKAYIDVFKKFVNVE